MTCSYRAQTIRQMMTNLPEPRLLDTRALVSDACTVARSAILTRLNEAQVPDPEKRQSSSTPLLDLVLLSLIELGYTKAANVFLSERGMRETVQDFASKSFRQTVMQRLGIVYGSQIFGSVHDAKKPLLEELATAICRLESNSLKLKHDAESQTHNMTWHEMVSEPPSYEVGAAILQKQIAALRADWDSRHAKDIENEVKRVRNLEASVCRINALVRARATFVEESKELERQYSARFKNVVDENARLQARVAYLESLHQGEPAEIRPDSIQ